MKIFTPERFETKPDAVFLDLDNTLYDYDKPHTYALKSIESLLCKLFNLSERNFCRLYKESQEIIKNRLGTVASSHSRLLCFQTLLEQLGVCSQIQLSLELEQTYWRNFLANAELFQDVEKFFNKLRLLGIPVVIVTDLSSQIQYRKLIWFEIDKYLDAVVTSEEAGADKPNQVIFELARKKLGLKENNNIWFIGDNYEKDIIGAKNVLNATTILKTSNNVLQTFLDGYFNKYSTINTTLDRFKIYA